MIRTHAKIWTKRYHGVYANRSVDRLPLPRPPARTDGEATAVATGSKDAPAHAAVPSLGPAPSPTPASRSRLSWARLLKRVFFVDALTCPRCNLAMVVLAFLSDPAVVGRILRHLGLPDVAPAVAPARRCFTPDLFSCVQTWDGCEEA